MSRSLIHCQSGTYSLDSWWTDFFRCVPLKCQCFLFECNRRPLSHVICFFPLCQSCPLKPWDQTHHWKQIFFFFYCIFTPEYSFCLTKAWEFLFRQKSCSAKKNALYGIISSLLFFVEQSCPTPAAEHCHSLATKQINGTNLFVGDTSSMGFIEICIFFNLCSLKLMTCFISSVYSISLYFDKTKCYNFIKQSLTAV